MTVVAGTAAGHGWVIGAFDRDRFATSVLAEMLGIGAEDVLIEVRPASD